jgi:hypothetical protein
MTDSQAQTHRPRRQAHHAYYSSLSEEENVEYERPHTRAPIEAVKEAHLIQTPIEIKKPTTRTVHLQTTSSQLLHSILSLPPGPALARRISTHLSVTLALFLRYKIHPQYSVDWILRSLYMNRNRRIRDGFLPVPGNLELSLLVYAVEFFLTYAVAWFNVQLLAWAWRKAGLRIPGGLAEKEGDAGDGMMNVGAEAAEQRNSSRLDDTGVKVVTTDTGTANDADVPPTLPPRPGEREREVTLWSIALRIFCLPLKVFWDLLLYLWNRSQSKESTEIGEDTESEDEVVDPAAYPDLPSPTSSEALAERLAVAGTPLGETYYLNIWDTQRERGSRTRSTRMRMSLDDEAMDLSGREARRSSTPPSSVGSISISPTLLARLARLKE